MSKKKDRRRKAGPGTGAMGGTEHTKGWKKRYAKKRRDEERYWASLASDVTVRHVERGSDEV